MKAAEFNAIVRPLLPKLSKGLKADEKAVKQFVEAVEQFSKVVLYSFNEHDRDDIVMVTCTGILK